MEYTPGTTHCHHLGQFGRPFLVAHCDQAEAVMQRVIQVDVTW